MEKNTAKAHLALMSSRSWICSTLETCPAHTVPVLPSLGTQGSEVLPHTFVIDAAIGILLPS